MKKYIILALSLITLLLNIWVVNAEMVTVDHMKSADYKKQIWLTDEEQAERIKIVYYYHDFWYKNMYVLFNKYILPEYDRQVIYEDLSYLSKKDTRFNNSWYWSDLITWHMSDSSSEKFIKAYNFLMWTNMSWVWTFWYIAKYYVSWEADYMMNETDNPTKFSKSEWEKRFKESLLYLFDYWFQSYSTSVLSNRSTCDWYWLDKFVRWNNKNFINQTDWKCYATYTNPDLDKFKNSIKEFLTWNNSYFSPVTVEVDPDYWNYINLYKIKENQQELVTKVLWLPAWYENNKKPSVKLATTWWVNVQEKYPSIYETNNVIFNPYTWELNDYIVAFGNYFWETVFCKYWPCTLPWPLVNTASSFFLKRDTNQSWTKSLSANYLKPIYSNQNTLSSKPHYYSTYNEAKISSSSLLNTQDTNSSLSNSSSSTNTSNTSNTTSSTSNLWTVFTTFEMYIDWKKYSVPKYNWIYFRTKDELYNYYYNYLVKPFLSKSKMSEADFWKDVDYKASLIKKNFDNRWYSNTKRLQIINKLNDNLKLFKYVLNTYKPKYDSDSVRYEKNYMIFLEVFYILNYDNKLLNWNESNEYSNFAKAFGLK